MFAKRISIRNSLRSTLSFAALGIAFVGAGCASAQQQLERGEELYGFCAQCHGPEAHGIRDVNAPGLTNLDGWYLERQLEEFSAAMRGRPDRDVHESPMIFVARAYDDPDAVADLVAYIDSLPGYDPARSVMGDANAGRQLYSACDSCHGASGEGDVGLRAPALAGLDDWHLVAELREFTSGDRGTHQGDMYGQQMVPVSRVLTDEQAIFDIVAYINTLL